MSDYIVKITGQDSPEAILHEILAYSINYVKICLSPSGGFILSERGNFE